ncbi:LysR family transcriptional regulator [Roseovarius sp. MMSF_3281]|uniref:LysR family transcriptional regulator n=1 Tax=Roseovarius sp. MMSF_3281 TaxID=3046694 RepID=UPI00273F08DC|nr:LysR family transcriptional regulator [Roseovarius sp. MMSF_3281]
MTLDQIRSFYLVAKLGTYQKAADRLNATQPAISARVAALETRLRTKLFDRTGHSVTLTPHGRRFLSYAEKMLELMNLAEIDLSRGHEIGGVFRIGASDTMIMSWVPEFLLELGNIFPELIVELQVGPSPRLRDELIAHELDMAFIVGPVTAPELISQPICECPMVLTAAPELGLHGKKLKLEELERFNMLTFERKTQPHQKLKRDLRARGVSARLNPISSLATGVLLATKGFGIAALPLVAVEDEIAAGRLMLLDSELELSAIQFSICYCDGPDAVLASRVVDAALDHLRARESRESINISF